MTFRFLSPALIELTEAAEYYEEKVPGLGTEFIDEADAALALILNYPEAWTRVSENYRHCNFRKFPYTIIYARRSDKEILIISVFHQSREPLSWRRNLQLKAEGNETTSCTGFNKGLQWGDLRAAQS